MENSGKTSLIIELVRYFQKQGLSASTVKHAHHAFDIDRPGKDSFLHREAGAKEVLVASSNRWALMHELQDTKAPSLRDSVRHLGDTDIILAEGFKSEPHPKIEIYRDHNADLIARSDQSIRAVVIGSEIVGGCPVTTLNRQNVEQIANFIQKIH